MRISGLVSLLLLASLIAAAGCSASQPHQGGSVPSSPHAGEPTLTTSAPVSPAMTAPALPEGTTLVPVVPAPTWIQHSTAENSADDPFIQVLQFTPEYLPFRIPDCGMRAAFPQAATDKRYGISQPEPKLLAITPAQMKAFMNAFAQDAEGDPNRIGGSACEGLVVTPTWNVVRIDATLIPRNARPADYDIGINVRSKGKIADQLTLARPFILDQPVILELYIPLKTEETDAFDSVELVFAKRPVSPE